MTDPRLKVKPSTLLRVKRLAKRKKVTMASLNDKIVLAGLKALGL